MLPGATEKVCAKCKISKTPEAFSPSKQQKDGLFPYCKECNRVICRAKYARNPEPYKEYNREYGKAYRATERGKESAKARSDKWRAKHPEQRAEIMRKWREANTEKRKLYMAAWKESNRAHVQEEVRKRYMLRKKYSSVPFTESQLLEKIAYWGNACWICGGAWEHVDHVKPLGKGGAHILSNLRPACRKCNQSKHAKWSMAEYRKQFGLRP
jgi:hypothetical protein